MDVWSPTQKCAICPKACRLKPDDLVGSAMANRYSRYTAVLFWLALIVAVTMATLPHPPRLAIDRFGDKFEHMLAFSTLTILGLKSFPTLPPLRLAERLSFIGALIEVVQSIPSLHRDCDIRDWVADTAAILIVIGINKLWRLSHHEA